VSGAARTRLFVALELPEQVRTALAAWGAGVAADVHGERPLRVLPPESLHVTLCFLGWRDEGHVEAIAALALGAVPVGAPAPRLALGAPAWLPRRRPRVLAVDLADDGGALAGLQAQVSDALEAGAGFEPRDHARRARGAGAASVRGRRGDAVPLAPVARGGAVRAARARGARGVGSPGPVFREPGGDSMAVKLHRCSTMWVKIGAHPCWKVQKALDEAGVEYEVVKGPMRKGQRDDLEKLSGQKMYPVIEFEDGRVYRAESKEMAQRISEGKLFDQSGAQPGAQPGPAT